MSASPSYHLLGFFYCWAWGYMAWNITLTSLGQLSRLCPLELLAHPYSTQWFGGGWEKEKAFMLCKQDSAIVKTLIYGTHSFSQKSKPQHHTGCCIKLTPSRPDPVDLWNLVANFPRWLYKELLGEDKW